MDELEEAMDDLDSYEIAVILIFSGLAVLFMANLSVIYVRIAVVLGLAVGLIEYLPYCPQYH